MYYLIFYTFSYILSKQFSSKLFENKSIMPALQKYEAGNWEAKKPELTRSEASSFALLSADFLWLWNRTVQLYFHSSSTIEGNPF
jgi:hypothetical protein